MKKHILISGAFILFLLIACNKQEEPELDPCSEVTYENGVKAFLTTNCTNGYCHGGAPDIPGLSNYEGAREVALNGKLAEMVIEKREMPPSGEGVSAEDMELLQCWIDNNAPE